MTASLPPFDLADLVERVDDPVLAEELVADFLARADAEVAAIRGISKDARELAIRVHRVRGMLATLGASRAARVASDLEEMAHARSAPGAVNERIERLAAPAETATLTAPAETGRSRRAMSAAEGCGTAS